MPLTCGFSLLSQVSVGVCPEPLSEWTAWFPSGASTDADSVRASLKGKVE